MPICLLISVICAGEKTLRKHKDGRAVLAITAMPSTAVPRLPGEREPRPHFTLHPAECIISADPRAITRGARHSRPGRRGTSRFDPYSLTCTYYTQLRSALVRTHRVHDLSVCVIASRRAASHTITYGLMPFEMTILVRTFVKVNVRRPSWGR